MIFLSILLIPLITSAQELCVGKANCILESTSPPSIASQKNIFGRPLKTCSKDPLTGFFRTGTCQSDLSDKGNHSICAELTKEFLSYTKNKGNDLSSPNPRYNFPGLKPGDRWCLCAARWLEAKREGIVTKVDLEATSLRALEVTSNFNFEWKNRVIECSLDTYAKQYQELQKDPLLTKQLKLVSIPKDGIKKGCRLVGLDGGIKEEINFFSLSRLKKLINAMPMRKAELND